MCIAVSKRYLKIRPRPVRAPLLCVDYLACMYTLSGKAFGFRIPPKIGFLGIKNRKLDRVEYNKGELIVTGFRR
jgi:hypothetical protein